AGYPSTGVFRFSLGYVLLGCVALRKRAPHREKLWLLAESLTVTVATLWSVETFTYVACTYLAILLCEAVSGIVPMRVRVRRAAARLAVTLLCTGIALALLELATRLRAGVWPHWSYYFDYVRLYSTGGFGTMTVTPWSSWALVVGVYAASLI